MMTAEDTRAWLDRQEEALEAGLKLQREREGFDLSREAPAWAEPLQGYREYRGPGGEARLLGYLEREDPVWASAALLALRNLGHAPFGLARSSWEESAAGAPMRDALGLVMLMSWRLPDAVALEEAWGAQDLGRALHGWLFGLQPEDGALWEAVGERMRAFGEGGSSWLEGLEDRVLGELDAESGAMMAWEHMCGGVHAATRVSAAYLRRSEDADAYWFLGRALEILERLGEVAGADAAMEGLDSEHHERAARVLIRLGDEGVERAHPKAIAWRGDEARRDRRSSAVRVFVGHVSERSSEALWALARDTDRHVRHAVWYALAGRGHEGILDEMIEHLESEDVLEVEEARAVLGGHPDARARAALESALALAQERGDEDAIDDLRYVLGM